MTKSGVLSRRPTRDSWPELLGIPLKRANTSVLAVAGTVVAAFLAGAAAVPSSAQTASAIEGVAGNSGLPVPRFVSLKSDRVNLRSGPGTEYPTAWVFRRAGMPVEVIREFESWRQVRDPEGATGWVLSVMLSGRRTAVVLPWEVKPGAAAPTIPLRESSHDNARPLAVVEAGVIANVRTCDRRWCVIVVGDYRGYVEQNKLWGVYPDEVIK